MAVLGVAALALFLAGTGRADASMIVLQDLGESISVTVDGNPIANGGRISNLMFNGESVSFDISTLGVDFFSISGFTNLLEPANADDPQGTVSDRFVVTTTEGATTYHVTLGSDPDLPTIPPGATDLTTIPDQGLPPNPYYEDGTVQKVGTIFNLPGGGTDTYFIQSAPDATAAPEPSSLTLLGLGALGLLGYWWRKRKQVVA